MNWYLECRYQPGYRTVWYPLILFWENQADDTQTDLLKAGFIPAQHGCGTQRLWRDLFVLPTRDVNVTEAQGAAFGMIVCWKSWVKRVLVLCLYLHPTIWELMMDGNGEMMVIHGAWDDWVCVTYKGNNLVSMCHTVALPCTWKVWRQKKRIMETRIFHHAKKNKKIFRKSSKRNQKSFKILLL
jgi:hypothetical protein